MKQSKTSKPDLERFKALFSEWQKQFGLDGWQVYFDQKPLGDRYANIGMNCQDMTATITLNSGENTPPIDLEATAKHEAIHLLLGRMTSCGESRWCDFSEWQSAVEETVNRIEKLL